MNSIGSNMRFARKSAHYTLERLASEAGVSITSLGSWENDITVPLVTNVEAVADVLGITIDQLIKGPSNHVCVVCGSDKMESIKSSDGKVVGIECAKCKTAYRLEEKA